MKIIALIIFSFTLVGCGGGAGGGSSASSIQSPTSDARFIPATNLPGIMSVAGVYKINGQTCTIYPNGDVENFHKVCSPTLPFNNVYKIHNETTEGFYVEGVYVGVEAWGQVVMRIPKTLKNDIDTNGYGTITIGPLGSFRVTYVSSNG